MSQPHINKQNPHIKHTPIYDRVDEVIQNKNKHIESLKYQAVNAKREYILKSQGYEHDDDVIDQMRYRKEVTPPRKIDEH